MFGNVCKWFPILFVWNLSTLKKPANMISHYLKPKSMPTPQNPHSLLPLQEMSSVIKLQKTFSGWNTYHSHITYITYIQDAQHSLMMQGFPVACLMDQEVTHLLVTLPHSPMKPQDLLSRLDSSLISIYLNRFSIPLARSVSVFVSLSCYIGY